MHYYIPKEPLIHSGVGHENGGHSGRYPWGSGDNPYQHSDEWLAEVQKRKKMNFTFTDPETGEVYTGDKAIAYSFQMTTKEFKQYKQIARSEQKAADVARIHELQDQGITSPSEIGRIMHKNESSIRSLLNEEAYARSQTAKNTADFLRDFVDEYGMVEVGAGAELNVGNGISRDRFETALTILKGEGYNLYNVGMPQVTNRGQQFKTLVLTKPDVSYKDAYDYGRYNYIPEVSESNMTTDDGGQTYRPSFVYPASLDSSRLMVRYPKDGGDLKDGLVEIRRGVKDLSLGNSNYAQVRIMVDDTHYIKGMAVYSDGKDMPDGVDIIFNTSKPDGTPLKSNNKNDTTVLKMKKKDPNNPFGSLIKEDGGQSYYDDPNGDYIDPLTGNRQSLSLINKRGDEGDWRNWSDNLPAQFLSKQTQELIDKQLDISKGLKKAQYDEISLISNPVVRKYYLQDFASDCDSNAVSLKAAMLPGQAYKVILPCTSLKDNEVYAPHLNNGDTVALIRYPHGGRFEIPILTVNNKNKEAQAMLTKTPSDAIGINKNVAEQLSGADFDGDTVMVIPCNSPNSGTKIAAEPRLKDLIGWDDKLAYPEVEGMTYMTKEGTQREMGIISNLINDMTLQDATEEEMTRAVKHSMVVIDAEKHKLNYMLSFKENKIADLKEKYQGHYNEKSGRMNYGAATLISKSGSTTYIPKRQGSGRIDKETGNLIYKPSDQLYYVKEKKTYYDADLGKEVTKTYNKTVYNPSQEDLDSGKVLIRTQESTAMADTDDAFTLVSKYRTSQEIAYANYANFLKDTARKARLESVSDEMKVKVNKQAEEAYKTEVDSLKAKLLIAEKNAYKEREAQALANSRIKEKVSDDPGIKSNKGEYSKLSTKELQRAREEVGAKRREFDITDKEWSAIQAGAINSTTLTKILRKTNQDRLRELAMPSNSKVLTDAQISQIKAYQANGYTLAEIANAIGRSESVVNNVLNS